MTMRIWVTFWVAVFLLLDVLDRTAQVAGDIRDNVLEKDWFAGLVVVINVAAVLRVMGVW